MKRLLSAVLVVSLVVVSTDCGNVFIRGSMMTGAVTFVQLGNVLSSSGGTVQVTFVTFLQKGFSSTLGFCDDQRSLFPVDQTVRVNFNPGQPCATILVVVIIV